MEVLDFSKMNSSTEADLFATLEEATGGSETPSVTKEEEKQEDSKEKNEPELNVLEVLEGNSETDEKNKEVKTEVKKETDTPPQKNSKTSSVPFNLVFKSLAEEGVLSSFDDDEYSKEVEELGETQALVNVFAREADIARQVAKDEVEEDKKEVLNLYSNLLEDRKSVV